MEDLALLTKFRQDLHRIPELDFDLPETIAYVHGVLDGLSCEVTSPCRGCVAAFFDVDAKLGRPHGPATAIRADMDALPITERSGVSFCSTKPGYMHACGHDGHMAMALAAACWVNEVLAGDATEAAHLLPRNVLFVFQPAEETTGGARLVCESGVFERYGADRIFGFHVWPDLPAGTIASRPGPLLARASETHLNVHGTSSHIAKSADGHDALLAAAHFLTEVETLMARLSQDEPCLLKFGHIESGTVCNAISASSAVEGSLRVFSDNMFDCARTGVEQCAAQACEAYGCTYDLSFATGYPPVDNDRALYALAAGALGDTLDGIEEPLLIAEDFAFYQRHLPGVFFLLGTGTSEPLHSDKFHMDEGVLAHGLAAYRTLLGIA